MRKTFLLIIPAILLVGLGVGAQPPTLGEPVVVGPDLPPLTVGSALTAKGRVQAYLDYQARMAPRSATLRGAGLSAENDAVEQTTATPIGIVGPAHVGLLLTRPPTSKEAVDPGLGEISRLVLRARLGREPTAAEVGAELRAFDTRIAQLNRFLADMRPQIAKAVARTAAFPRQLEAPLLGVAPSDPQSGSAAAEAGFRAIFQRVLTGEVGL